MTADVDVGWTRPELAEHVRDEHSTFTWLLEPMIERAGFDISDATYTTDQDVCVLRLHEAITATVPPSLPMRLGTEARGRCLNRRTPPFARACGNLGRP